MVCFLNGLRGNLLCTGENKTSTQKPCLYTGNPVCIRETLSVYGRPCLYTGDPCKAVWSFLLLENILGTALLDLGITMTDV